LTWGRGDLDAEESVSRHQSESGTQLYYSSSHPTTNLQ
jgi:hypothetical protein